MITVKQRKLLNKNTLSSVEDCTLDRPGLKVERKSVDKVFSEKDLDPVDLPLSEAESDRFCIIRDRLEGANGTVAKCDNRLRDSGLLEFICTVDAGILETAEHAFESGHENIDNLFYDDKRFDRIAEISCEERNERICEFGMKRENEGQFEKGSDELDWMSDATLSIFSHRLVEVRAGESERFYDFKEFLAQGRFGHVHRCVEKRSELQLAAKCVRCKKPIASQSGANENTQELSRLTEVEPLDRNDVLREIAIMNRLNHPNIVKLYDAFGNDDEMTLVFEYLEGGELLDRVLSDQSEINELDAIIYTRQIVEAAEYLHKNSILHLDLKPENILCISRTSRHIKVIDFGLSRICEPDQGVLVQWGTPEFMAPEIFEDDVATSGTDMWSVGVITYILLTGTSPFDGETFHELMTNVVDCRWRFDNPLNYTLTEEGKDFVSRLLTRKESGRMSATQCLRHEWLAAPLSGERIKKLSSRNLAANGSAWKYVATLSNAINWIKQNVFELKSAITFRRTPTTHIQAT